MPAINVDKQNAVIGIGLFNSATVGAIIVPIFPKTLQIPKAVAANIAGNIYALAKYAILKVAATPNLASNIIIGIISTLESKRIRDNDPSVPIIKHTIRVTRIPNLE